MTTIAQLSAALADRYVIERPIGAGGMATVYLARDVKHNRRVALKVLKPELGAVLGVERFLSEIQVTANLQHPNLLPLFDSGEVDGLLFYVMPFVEGETLRVRLDREKQLPLDAALHIATAAASALDYAHRHGVIHRDLKPENILLQDGEPLVADFGIALAVSNAGGNRITQTGLSLGTPQYMSPEQATGDRAIDGRTDIYSLGAVLYEMLSGEPPHIGNTAQAVIARVLTERPRSVRLTRASVPDYVSAAVDRALEKLPADRFSTVREMADALHGRGPTLTAVSTEASRARRRTPVRAALPWVVAAAGVTLGIVGVVRRPAANLATPPAQFVIPLPIGYSANDARGIAISPDGRRIVLAAANGDSSRLFERPIDSLGWRAIPSTDGVAYPRFGRDGHTLFFVQRGKVMRLANDGSPPTEVTSGSWEPPAEGDDGSLYLARHYNAGITRLGPSGGDARELTHPDSAKLELGHWRAEPLPGGKAIVFNDFSIPLNRSHIDAMRVDGGGRTRIADNFVWPRYVDGLLLMGRGSVVFAAPFNVDKLALAAPPVAVQRGVTSFMSNGAVSFDVSANGTLVYIPEEVDDPVRSLVWVTRSGQQRPALPLPARYGSPRLSPDGKRIALVVTSDAGHRNVWIYDVDRAGSVRITDVDASTASVTWAPDGNSLLYSTEDPVFDVYRRESHGTTPEVRIAASHEDKIVSSVLRDGRTILISHSPSSGESEVAALSEDGGKWLVHTLFGSGHQNGQPAMSPNEGWVAYTTDESGAVELVVRSYPDVSRVRRQVWAGGAGPARWTKNGREIVFQTGNRMMAAPFDPASGDVGKPVELFRGSFLDTFDVTPDGERFLLVQLPKENPQYIVVATNWLETVRKRLAAR